MVFLCSSKSIFCYATYDGFLVLPEPPLVIVSFFVATGPGNCCEMPGGLAFEHTSDDITMKYCTRVGRKEKKVFADRLRNFEAYADIYIVDF